MGFDINLKELFPKAGWKEESSKMVSKWMSPKEALLTEAALKRLNPDIQLERSYLDDKIRLSIPPCKMTPSKGISPKIILKHEIMKLPPLSYGDTMSRNEAEMKLEKYPIGSWLVYFSPEQKLYCCLVKRVKGNKESNEFMNTRIGAQLPAKSLIKKMVEKGLFQGG